MMRGITKLAATTGLQQVPIPKLKPGHVLVKNEYAGVNFIDIYFRDGLYPAKEGQVLGMEAGGVVVDEDMSVSPSWKGKRVVFFEMGGFADYSLVPVNKLVPVPAQVSLPNALALTTMGLTAHYLCTSIGKLDENSRVLVHAAGSGTGRLVAQIASRVFKCQSVVGTCSLAKTGSVPLPSNQVVASYTDVDAILAANGGGEHKFDVVLDGVGKDTYQTSLECCRPRGLVVLYGNASGPVPLIDPLKDLNARGSLFVTRPNLGNYVSTHEELLQRANDVFAWLAGGLIELGEPTVFEGLESAGEAMEFVKQRRNTTKVVVRL